MPTNYISSHDHMNSISKLNDFASGKSREGGESVNNNHEIKQIIRDLPNADGEKTNLKNFAQDMQRLHKILTNQKVGNIGYLNYLKNQAINSKGEQGVRTIIIDTLSNIIGKLAKGDTGKSSLNDSKAVASGVIKSLLHNFPKQAHKMGLGTVDTHEVADKVVKNMQRYIDSVNTSKKPHSEILKLARNWTRFERPHKTGDVLSMVAPRGDRNDRHCHDLNGYGGKFDRNNEGLVSLQYVGRFSKDQGIKTIAIMPIPHSLSTDPKYDPQGKKQQQIQESFTTNKHYVIPYYEDRIPSGEGKGEQQFISTFSSFDRHLINQTNKAPDQERLTPSATGIEVRNDPKVLAENAAHAKAVALAMTRAKLEAGEKKILIEFGELTGNKPAVPQDVVSKGGRRAFIEGTHAVLSGVYESAYNGAMDAIKARQDNGHDVSDTDVQIRIIYHNDADPKVAERDTKTVAIKDINEALLAIDKDVVNFGKMPRDLTDKGVNVGFVMQNSHLMGAAVADVNQHDRAPALQQAITIHRNEAKALRLVVDASWLTASARATTRGMAHYLEKSGNPKLQNLSGLMMKADEVANAGFMKLNSGERLAQQRFFEGDPKRDPSLVHDLALLREGQRKANMTYHSVLGEIHENLQDAVTITVLNNYVKSLNEDGLVTNGNYIGMLLQLAKSHDPSGIQDKTPFVWGSDNLIPAHSFSGDLKVDMYTSQHGSLEVVLHNLSESPHVAGEDKAIYRQIFSDFRLGSPYDRAFLEREESKRLTVKTDNFREDTDSKPVHEDPDHLRYAPQSIISPFRGKGTGLRPTE